MNGEPIPAVHGGPVRLIVPGYYGTMNVKWIGTIRFEAHESYNYNQIPRYRVPIYPVEPGKFSKKDFTFENSRPNWHQKVKSVIFAPLDGETVKAGTVKASGTGQTASRSRLARPSPGDPPGAPLDGAHYPIPVRRYTLKRLLPIALLTLVPALAQLTELPPGPGRDLAYTKCQQCHDLGYVLDSAGLDREAWKDLILSMMDAGLEPPEEAAEQVKKDVAGIEVYKKACVACHGENGQGVPGAFPPLAENPYLFKDRAYPALVVLFGLEGPIEVKGQTYSGLMPSFAYLSDEEIAAVVAFVRNNFGNEKLRPKGFEDLTPEEVKTLRQKNLQAKDVRALREALK